MEDLLKQLDIHIAELDKCIKERQSLQRMTIDWALIKSLLQKAVDILNMIVNVIPNPIWQKVIQSMASVLTIIIQALPD